MNKFRILLLMVAIASSNAAFCGVGGQSSSVDSTIPTDTTEIDSSGQPTTAGTNGTTTGTTTALTGTTTATNGTTTAANTPATATPPVNTPPPPEPVSRQTVLTPAAGVVAAVDSTPSAQHPPTSWQTPASASNNSTTKTTPQRLGRAPTTDSSTASTMPTTKLDSTTGGAQLAGIGSGRGGASKDPISAANIAKAGSAEVSNGYTFFVGVLIAGAILAFALLTYLRANSEEAKNRTR